jgi:DNA-binding XRE family transcriptional regulator
MGKLKRITRDRHLTSEEAARDKTVRQQVMEEFPPVRPPLIRRAGKLLREERERQQLTQAEAAKKTGLSREVICRIENQPNNVTTKTLERYARGLGFELEIALVPAKARHRKRRRTA